MSTPTTLDTTARSLWTIVVRDGRIDRDSTRSPFSDYKIVAQWDILNYGPGRSWNGLRLKLEGPGLNLGP